jgi:hypothetical protein
LLDVTVRPHALDAYDALYTAGEQTASPTHKPTAKPNTKPTTDPSHAKDSP